MNKWKHLDAKFIGLYVLLGVFGAIGVMGVVLNFTYNPPLPKTLAHKSDIKQALGETSLGKAACAYTATQAASQGVILKSCLVEKVSVNGNQATVRLKMTDTTNRKFTLLVYLSKGVWQGTNLDITS